MSKDKVTLEELFKNYDYKQYKPIMVDWGPDVGREYLDTIDETYENKGVIKLRKSDIVFNSNTNEYMMDGVILRDGMNLELYINGYWYSAKIHLDQVKNKFYALVFGLSEKDVELLSMEVIQYGCFTELHDIEEIQDILDDIQ